jgi:microcystin-dependent protein
MAGRFVIVDAAETAFLDLLTAVNYTARLYVGDMVTGQTEATLEAYDETDFTEASFAGYAAKALTGGSWTTTAGDPSAATYADQTWTRSSTGTAQSVYGVYYTLTSGGALQWFEQFEDGPVVFEFINDDLTLTPTLNLDDTEGAGNVQTGIIAPYGGTTAPTGWLLCDGTAVDRTTYATLFAVIGTTYGAGNGSTTFNLPDMRGRFPLGKAASGTGSTLGSSGGDLDHEHTLDHDRAFAEIYAATTPNDYIYMRRLINTLSGYDVNYRLAGTTSTATGAGATAGVGLQGDTDGNNPAYLVHNYIIKT